MSRTLITDCQASSTRFPMLATCASWVSSLPCLARTVFVTSTTRLSAWKLWHQWAFTHDAIKTHFSVVLSACRQHYTSFLLYFCWKADATPRNFKLQQLQQKSFTMQVMPMTDGFLAYARCLNSPIAPKRPVPVSSNVPSRSKMTSLIVMLTTWWGADSSQHCCTYHRRHANILACRQGRTWQARTVGKFNMPLLHSLQRYNES